MGDPRAQEQGSCRGGAGGGQPPLGTELASRLPPSVACGTLERPRAVVHVPGALRRSELVSKGSAALGVAGVPKESAQSGDRTPNPGITAQEANSQAMG